MIATRLVHIGFTVSALSAVAVVASAIVVRRRRERRRKSRESVGQPLRPWLSWNEGGIEVTAVLLNGDRVAAFRAPREAAVSEIKQRICEQSERDVTRMIFWKAVQWMTGLSPISSSKARSRLTF